jgi:hypothetical protein
MNDENVWLYDESPEDVEELVSAMSIKELKELVAAGSGFWSKDCDRQAKIHKIIAGEKYSRTHCRS